MSEPMEDYLRVAQPIVDLHNEAGQYAVFVNEEISNVNGGVSPYPLCATALFAITADLVGFHHSVLDLCRSGWAFATVALIRSMMDVFLSALVLTERRDNEAEYRGVKYTHGFLKESINASNLTKEEVVAQRSQIASAISRAPAAIQERVHDFFYRDPLGAYWFNPEYRSPTDVISHLSKPDIAAMYRSFSSGSHGGFLGLRILKDQPDDIHPNPRPDPKSQRMAIVGSSRLLVETMFLRDYFENSGKTLLVYEGLVERISQLTQVVH